MTCSRVNNLIAPPGCTRRATAGVCFDRSSSGNSRPQLEIGPEQQVAGCSLALCVKNVERVVLADGETELAQRDLVGDGAVSAAQIDHQLAVDEDVQIVICPNL